MAINFGFTNNGAFRPFRPGAQQVFVNPAGDVTNQQGNVQFSAPMLQQRMGGGPGPVPQGPSNGQRMPNSGAPTNLQQAREQAFGSLREGANIFRGGFGDAAKRSILGSLTGANVPFTDLVQQNMFSQQADMAGAQEQAQMRRMRETLAQSGLGAGAAAAMQRQFAGERGDALAGARNQISTQAQLENFAAQERARQQATQFMGQQAAAEAPFRLKEADLLSGMEQTTQGPSLTDQVMELLGGGVLGQSRGTGRVRGGGLGSGTQSSGAAVNQRAVTSRRKPQAQVADTATGNPAVRRAKVLPDGTPVDGNVTAQNPALTPLDQLSGLRDVMGAITGASPRPSPAGGQALTGRDLYGLNDLFTQMFAMGGGPVSLPRPGTIAPTGVPALSGLDMDATAGLEPTGYRNVSDGQREIEAILSSPLRPAPAPAPAEPYTSLAGPERPRAIPMVSGPLESSMGLRGSATGPGRDQPPPEFRTPFDAPRQQDATNLGAGSLSPDFFAEFLFGGFPDIGPGGRPISAGYPNSPASLSPASAPFSWPFQGEEMPATGRVTMLPPGQLAPMRSGEPVRPGPSGRGPLDDAVFREALASMFGGGAPQQRFAKQERPAEQFVGDRIPIRQPVRWTNPEAVFYGPAPAYRSNDGGYLPGWWDPRAAIRGYYGGQ